MDGGMCILEWSGIDPLRQSQVRDLKKLNTMTKTRGFQKSEGVKNIGESKVFRDNHKASAVSKVLSWFGT